MSEAYATIADVKLLWRDLMPDEETRADALLPVISDLLRQAAINEGRDLDEMIAASVPMVNTAKSVTVDILARVLRQRTTGDVMTQESQTALGYTWQGTFAIPGGGIAGAIMRNDLKRLGLRTQTAGVVNLAAGCNSPSACKDQDRY